MFLDVPLDEKKLCVKRLIHLFHHFLVLYDKDNLFQDDDNQNIDALVLS